MSEIVFEVTDAPEGGYTARALEASIFTEADTLSELSEMVRDAVLCHYEEGRAPMAVRIRRGELLEDLRV